MAASGRLRPSLAFIYGILTILATAKKVSGTTEKACAVLLAEANRETEDFCIIYFKAFHPLPKRKEETKFTEIYNASNEDLCSPPPYLQNEIKGKFVLAANNNCSLISRAKFVENSESKGLIIITTTDSVNDFDVNSSDVDPSNSVPVAIIGVHSAEDLAGMGENIKVLMFAPDGFYMNYGLVVIWVLAVSTVAIGAYWSGLVKYYLHCNEIVKLPGPDGTLARSDQSANKQNKQVQQEESSLRVSPLVVLIIVICMSLLLITLYFFFDYLVYVIITLFVVASIISLFSCLEPFVYRLPICNYKLPSCKCGKHSCSLQVYQILLFSMATALSLTWVVLRKESYAWVLQDILGISFSINMLKSIRLPNLKICTILLVLLFFYDIFFVFITPFLTAKGQSVMVEVATGGNSQEQLPMVLRVPTITPDPLRICLNQYSLLGFGDILVPGLLVSFCHGFDLINNTKRIYYVITTVSYSVGLIITFIGLYMMNSAQPALLYLVPATLLPVYLVGLCRGELGQLWVGNMVKLPSVGSATIADDQSPEEESTSTTTASPLENTPTNKEEDRLMSRVN